jgi:glycosyltransferase involved in cell wall biosynthesis
VAVVVENVALGVDTRLRKQVDDLLEAGFRVTVVTMRHDDNAPFRGRPALRLLEYPAPAEPTRPAGYGWEYSVALFWAAVNLTRLRLRGRIDVVQFCQPPDIYFPLFLPLKVSGTRVVVDQRDLMPELLRSRYDDPPAGVARVLRWLERRTQRSADVAITVNDYLRDRLIEAGAHPDRTVVVRNGPVMRRVLQSVPGAARGDDERLVVWAGKMGRQDRVDLAVRVAERLVVHHGRTDLRMVLLGDGECLDELRELVSELRLDSWVSFAGWLPEEDVFGFFATADLGLDTSLQEEVSPVKAMEYMAHGLPFVCFDLLETRRIATGCARFAPPGDLDRLADAVEELLDDEAERRLLGAAGRARVTNELAWERQTEAYLRAVGPRDPLRPDRAPRWRPRVVRDRRTGNRSRSSNAACGPPSPDRATGAPPLSL